MIGRSDAQQAHPVVRGSAARAAVGRTSPAWLRCAALSASPLREVPSEDPLLNGYFGQMYSIGMQNGSDPRYLQGIATLKHFDANQLEGNWPGPESVCTGGTCTRHTINASISMYDWASSYLPAFQRSVVQGGAQAVMCSYNACVSPSPLSCTTLAHPHTRARTHHSRSALCS